MGLVGRVFGRAQIAGVGIEGFEQSMQRAVGHVANAGLDHVVALDLVQDFLIHAHLAIGSITLRACAHTAQSKSTKENNNHKQYGNRKNSALKTLRHGKTRQLGADSRIILQPEGALLDYPRQSGLGLIAWRQNGRYRCRNAVPWGVLVAAGRIELPTYGL